MCEPVTASIAAMSQASMMAVQLGVAAVSTGVNYMAQQQMADAQVEAQEQNALNQRNASAKAMAQSNDDLQDREMQEQSATALKVHNAKMKARQAKATANASSTSAGLSMDALMADYDRQYASYADSQMQQLGFNTSQIQRQREGIQSQAEGRINTMPLNPVQGPSAIGAAAEFGASALNTYDQYSVVDPQTGKRTIS